jgi:CRP/FNR family cyclic AMP-dependent transcriptional regulator
MMAGARESGILERISVTAGHTIMREGEFGNSAFLLQAGSVRVMVTKDEKSVEVARLGPGQIFGEMALVFDGPRTATVLAVEDCTLIVITRKMLNQKLEKSDPTIRAIVPMLMKRIVQANNAVLNRDASIEDMVETVRTLYQNLEAGLPGAQKKTLQNAVLPKMEEFLNAAQSFADKYKAGNEPPKA